MVETEPIINIIVDEVTDEIGSVDPTQLGNGESRRPSSAISLYMVGKTFQWISRAKIASWFKMAFSIPDTEEISRSTTPEPEGLNRTPDLSRAASMISLAKRSPSPSRLSQAERKLTLEPEYKRFYPKDPSDFKPSFCHSSVAKMMRSASGNFSDELTNSIHDHMLKQTASSLTIHRQQSELISRNKLAEVHRVASEGELRI